jgi:hypothetical protein
MSAPTAKQALLRCLNVTNSQDVDIATLSFGVPTPSTEYNKNTTIVLSALPGTAYFGSRRFWYDRIPLSMLAMIDGGGATVPITMRNGQTVGDLLGPINTAQRTGVALEDLENGNVVLPELTMTPQPITLTANASSLVWMGELQVLVTLAKTDVGDILPNADLPGFVYTGPPSIS